MKHIARSLRPLVIALAVLSAPAITLAADAPPKPVDIDKLLKELRDLDTSTDMKGDHVVGETLC